MTFEWTRLDLILLVVALFLGAFGLVAELRRDVRRYGGIFDHGPCPLCNGKGYLPELEEVKR